MTRLYCIDSIHCDDDESDEHNHVTNEKNLFVNNNLISFKTEFTRK